MDLRQRALAALCVPDPADKVAAVRALWREAPGLPLGERPQPPAGPLPGRPDRPRLIDPHRVPQRSPHTVAGRAALLHAICHIEFNAINLGLDAVWRFDGMPRAFHDDWLRVAHEEAEHFSLLHELLLQLGHRYGDFDAHDGLWAMCEKTRDDIVARMALVPRTLEARGLDATPLIQQRLRAVGAPDALALCDRLDIILRDEVGHVAIGNHWYRWLCERLGLEPVAHYRVLVKRHAAPRLRPPFNDTARRAAGFTQAELDYLLDAGPGDEGPAPVDTAGMAG